MNTIVGLAIAGGVVAIAFGLAMDLLPRWPNTARRLTDWPLKGLPAANGAMVSVLFIALAAGALLLYGR